MLKWSTTADSERYGISSGGVRTVSLPAVYICISVSARWGRVPFGLEFTSIQNRGTVFRDCLRLLVLFSLKMCYLIQHLSEEGWARGTYTLQRSSASQMYVLGRMPYYCSLHVLERLINSCMDCLLPRLDPILVTGSWKPGREVVQEWQVLHEQSPR